MLNREQLEKMAEIYGGIAIFSVLPGSPTERAGVLAGDILLRVNGQSVEDLVSYVKARQLRNDGIELVVVRNGSEQTLWADELDTTGEYSTLTPEQVEAVANAGEEEPDEMPLLGYTMRPPRAEA